MTNLDLAKEQGSQAAPNILEAIKAGEIGSGSSAEERMFVKAVVSNPEDLESTALQILQEAPQSNILGICYVPGQTHDDDTVCIYVTYADWLQPIISYFNAYIEYAEAQGMPEEEMAEMITMRDYAIQCSESIPLNTVYTITADEANIIGLALYSDAYPAVGTLYVVTDNMHGLSSYALSLLSGVSGIEGIYPKSDFYVATKVIYLYGDINSDEAIGHGHSIMCYVDAAEAFDQAIADSSDQVGAPEIIRSDDKQRYDAFIIKGISDGSDAVLACVFSTAVLDMIDSSTITQELQAKIAAYKTAIEAAPTEYVTTNDADLCKYIERCMSFVNSSTGESLYGPQIRKNVVRTIIATNNTDTYSYTSASELMLCSDMIPSNCDIVTKDSHSVSSHHTYYIPSPLR